MKATDQVEIGTTGVNVTRLGLGTGPLGGLFEPVPEEQAIDTIQTALAQGIRYIDTAPLYGHGRSEERIGRAVAEIPRRSFVLSTKVGRILIQVPPAEAESEWFTDLPPLMPVFDFSYDGVMRSFESSLRRLSMEYVDIALVHDPDGAYEEVMQGAYKALTELKRNRAIRAIGVGCWDKSLLGRFAASCEFDIFLVPGGYTLLDQSAADGLLPLCQKYGISVVIGAPYASGILASGPRQGAKFNYADATPEILEHVKTIQRICERYGASVQAAALQFPFTHPAVASVIPGARSKEEVQIGIEMFNATVPAECLLELRHNLNGS